MAIHFLVPVLQIIMKMMVTMTMMKANLHWVPAVCRAHAHKHPKELQTIICPLAREDMDIVIPISDVLLNRRILIPTNDRGPKIATRE